MTATQQQAIANVNAFGEAVGKIAGLAASSLHESFPHLDLQRLLDAFTSDPAIAMIGTRYLAGLDEGKTPGEAAAAAGTALIHAWADARLAARAQLDQQTATA
ncbi:hypothetical protein GTY54_01785 [Streptomyces sp. SID625]|nr:hypothetical protein [Streptomyces sp. SID625]